MKKIPLTQGQFAIVDDDDFEELNKFKWFAIFCKRTNSFYAMRTYYLKDGKKNIQMQRAVLKTPSNMITDHINHDTLDNRKSNLRICTNSQNQMNRRVGSNNTSGTKGVSFCKKSKKWKANIKVNKKDINLGFFRDIKDAIKAREQGEIKYFGEFSYNNLNKGEK